MRWFVILLCLALAAPLQACLNDRDSRERAEEAKPEDPMQGLPEIPLVLRGDFERFPSLYYEMRRDRVAEELKQNPGELALYDDIAVALDRLGDDDLAIQYMEKKRQQLESAPGADADADGHAEWKEHWYSYHANLGTFYAHRWIHNGANLDAMADLQRGRELIARAIEIKPDAHFGREQYQLKAMDWIVSVPSFVEGENMPNMLGLTEDEITGGAGADRLSELGLDDAVVGLSGLIVLGATWESVDVTFALGLALRIRGDEENAYAALLRCKELIEAGRGSFVANSPQGGALIHMLGRMLPAPDDDDVRKAIERKFRIERHEAKASREKRNEVVLSVLKEGQHPDTHESFWDDVDRRERGYLPEPPGEAEETENPWLWIVLLSAVGLALGFTGFTLVRRNRTPEPPQVTPEEKLPMPGEDG